MQTIFSLAYFGEEKFVLPALSMHSFRNPKTQLFAESQAVPIKYH